MFVVMLYIKTINVLISRASVIPFFAGSETEAFARDGRVTSAFRHTPLERASDLEWPALSLTEVFSSQFVKKEVLTRFGRLNI